jgi:hypothetical protein
MTHTYTAKAGEACDIKLIKGSKDYEYNSVFFDVPDYTVYYGKTLYDEEGSVVTDGDACASVTFPTAGKWYLWVDGGYGEEYPTSIVSAPGYAEVTVTAEESARQPQDVSAAISASVRASTRKTVNRFKVMSSLFRGVLVLRYPRFIVSASEQKSMAERAKFF